MSTSRTPDSIDGHREPAPIATLEDLRRHLQWALELEHATIPPYFTAWRSIRPGTNIVVANVIRSVLIEEMLHLTLVANLLNAVDERPRLTYKRFVPTYPTRLPHSSADFVVSIAPLSPQLIETFLAIEHPTPAGATPQADHYRSISRFYAAIGDGIDHLCQQQGEDAVFTGNAARQVRPEDYYGAGNVIVVTDQDSAHAALTEIVHQGEGAPDTVFDDDANILGNDGLEVGHYYRFQQIANQHMYTQLDTPATGPTGTPLTVDYGAVLPIRANTRLSDYPEGSPIHRRLAQFSASYHELLAALERAFDGEPASFATAISWMFALHDQALALMRTPDPVGDSNVGLTFEPAPTASS